ncbi:MULTISPECIES: spore germination protein [unclassified Bacillus (in: firmicutes)]|uniref:spore germination protein n=1 Tax=unclassified Bacillus (in: firmicutes) TaxID=185979 RepID=UPI000BEF7BE0|nr:MULTISPECIES: spore germination protein [unclassified Bacillus (in: firmicutes)]PEJ60766.1 spore gernimation protein GerPA [Bacillus sp. AFS002410]PEL09727.1 spore gernimation protein GerPA [Bacillus sp. AFS017336]
MPAYVGVINIVSIGSSGVVNIGDAYNITPKSNAQTYAGAGSFNTGDNVTVYNNRSISNVYDQDQVDQPMVGNM